MKKIRDLINLRQKKKEAEERELAQLERLSKGFKLNHEVVDRAEQRIKDIKDGKIKVNGKSAAAVFYQSKVITIVREQEAKMPEVEKRILTLRKKLKKEK